MGFTAELRNLCVEPFARPLQQCALAQEFGLGRFEPLLQRQPLVCFKLELAPHIVLRFRNSPFSRPREQADLYRICPAWAACEAAEAATRYSGGSGDAALIPVDAALAKALKYAPLVKDASWLFKDLPRVLGLAIGAPVLKADPVAALRASISPAVFAILSAHRDVLVLAGGAVGASLAVTEPAFRDYDMFFHGVSREAADDIVDSIEAVRRDGGGPPGHVKPP